MKQMGMKKLLIVSMAVLLLAGSTALAVPPLLVPPWRGDPGSTHQEWGFSDNTSTPVPDVVDNPYGTPLLRVDPVGDWIPDPGAWPLSGQIDVYIPDRLEPWPEKEIWIQLIWQSGGNDPTLFLPDEPLVGVTPFDSIQMSRTDAIPFVPGWTPSLFKINMWPNPPEEWITIKGDILVDYLVIDTICIPEPATLVLLGIGGALMNLTRKRRFV